VRTKRWKFGAILDVKLWLQIPGGAKQNPELCITIRACILYKDKFPFAHLYINVYSYLFINFNDLTNDTTECRLMTQDELKIQLGKDSVPSHYIKATQISFYTKRLISSAHKNVHRIQQIWIPTHYLVWDTLQELVYVCKRMRFSNLDNLQNVIRDKWHDVDVRQSKIRKASGKASSSSSKGKWRTYGAHLLLIRWLMIQPTVMFWRSQRTTGNVNDEPLAKIAL